jgi:hypothetical protein
MRLICETCHGRWILPPGRKRHSSCPKCSRARDTVAIRRRRIIREARTVGSEPGPTVTPDELLKLMGELDLVSARALAVARAIPVTGRNTQ